MNRLMVFLATGFGVGSATVFLFQRLRFFRFPLPSSWTGAGLVGSLFALSLVWFGLGFQGWKGFAILSLLTFLAIFITDQAEKGLGEKDDPRIILDEIIGFFWATAFLPIPRHDTLAGHPPLKWGATVNGEIEREIVLFSAFLLFRIFDLAKLPFPQAQHLRGGFGVVVDDFCAGLLTNLLLQLIVRLFF